MILKRAKEAMFAAQQTMEEFLNRNQREISFELENKVWLSTKNLSKVHFDRGDKKLKQPYTGPYQVVEQVSDQTYRLDLKKDYPRLHPVFHVSLLWKEEARRPEDNYNPKDRKLVNEKTVGKPVSEVIMIEEDEDPVFEPESILERKGNKYLIRWKGMDETSDVWLSKSMTHRGSVIHKLMTECGEPAAQAAGLAGFSNRRGSLNSRTRD